MPVTHFDRELLRHGDVSKLVAESIRAGTREWEALVPHHVRDQIKALNLLGHRPRAIGNGASNGASSSSGEGSGSDGEGLAKKKAGAAGAA